MARLDLAGITKSFGTTTVLHGVDLAVEDGSFTVFVGPSGCGKSTLLRLICGLDEAGSGTIAIDGEVVNDVPPAKRGIAMVFQSYALYPHMSVAANMGYALRLAGQPRQAIERRVRDAASVLRIEHLLDRKPRQLSGGQRQRVAIGRAIVREPRIFLFDEPLSNLDAALRVEMRFELARLKQRLGTTTIYVTHDQTEAMTLADRIVVMHDGRVEQVGSPLDLYRTPANRFVAGFIGSPRMNFLAATVREGRDGHVGLAVGDAVFSARTSVPRASAVELGVRPEHWILGPADQPGSLPGAVVMTEQLGSDTYVYVATPAAPDPLLVRVDGETAVCNGDRVGLRVDERQVHVFEPDGASVARILRHDLPSAA